MLSTERICGYNAARMQQTMIATLEKVFSLMPFDGIVVLVTTFVSVLTIFWLARRFGGYIQTLLNLLVVGIFFFGINIAFRAATTEMMIKNPFVPNVFSLLNIFASFSIGLGVYTFYRNYIKLISKK